MSLFAFFTIAAMVCILGVTVALFWGLITMTKGAQKDRVASNKMMRIRVMFQALAILFLFLAYLAK